MRGYLRAWAGATPLEALALDRADLAGLPRLYVQAGGAERLRDEVVALVERARAAGVDVTLRVLPDLPHAAPLLQEYLPAGRAALEDAAAFVQDALVRDPDEVRDSTHGGATPPSEPDARGRG